MTVHALERADCRYNQELSHQDLTKMIEIIKHGGATQLSHLETGSQNKSFYFVKYNHVPYKVLFKKKVGKKPAKIITIYPLDVDEYNEIMERKHQEKIRKSIEFLKANSYIIYKNWRKHAENEQIFYKHFPFMG